MINPFIISSVSEQALLRAYTDREMWHVACRALGATEEQTQAWDAAAIAYAAITPYPNHLVVAYLRRIAQKALTRGEPWPTDVEQAIDDENVRGLLRTLDRLFP